MEGLQPTLVYVDPESGYLKVAKSRYQYQADKHGKQWVFRYDYLRSPVRHVHIRPAHSVHWSGAAEQGSP